MELVSESLGKRYGDLWAIRDVSLNRGPGLLGLVGPNGAGKTTFLRMVATLLPPTEGKVSWDGHDTQTQGEEVRQVLGYLPQEFGLYCINFSPSYLLYWCVASYNKSDISISIFFTDDKGALRPWMIQKPYRVCRTGSLLRNPLHVK